MIVRLVLQDANNERITMLFGDSYKSHLEQIQDFFQRFQVWIDGRAYPTDSIVSIETSLSKWKIGSLKWCESKQFQKELNREGCHISKDPGNPNPRQYSDMTFSYNAKVANSINNWYSERYQGRRVVKMSK